MTPDPRPLLVGMNNPLSRSPDDALVPWPAGCTGHRLYSMLHAACGATEEEYLTAFERTNLLVGVGWSDHQARCAAEKLAASGVLSGRKVVALGRGVQKALGLPWLLPMQTAHVMASIAGTTSTKFILMPHPSGANRWYNDPENVRRAGAVLADLYAGWLVATRGDAA